MNIVNIFACKILCGASSAAAAAELTVSVGHGCAHFVTFAEPRGSTRIGEYYYYLRVVSSTDRESFPAPAPAPPHAPSQRRRGPTSSAAIVTYRVQ